MKSRFFSFSAEKERREALLKKNIEREEKIMAKKKSWQEKNSHIAFGSSTPRMGYPVSKNFVKLLNFSVKLSFVTNFDVKFSVCVFTLNQ